MKWENLREEEFEGAIERSGGLCVIPIGCLEKHGQHLPVGADTMQARMLAEAAAEVEEVTIFPAAMWLGDVMGFHADLEPGKVGKRGGIGINPHTLLTVMEELCDEIARNGYRKILFLNFHGGNVALLDFFVRAQYYKPRTYATMWAWAATDKQIDPRDVYPTVLERREEFSYLTDADMEALEKFARTGPGGGHGDWKETGLMLGYDASLVAQDRYDAESGMSTHRADHLSRLGISCGRFWPSNFPNSYSGYPPFGCSENIGKVMIKLSVERLAAMFKAIKEDEDCVAMSMRLPRAEKKD